MKTLKEKLMENKEKISNKYEYETYVEKNKEKSAFAHNLNKKTFESGIKKEKIKGYCDFCQKEVKLRCDYTAGSLGNINFRESMICLKCQLNNRMRAVFGILNTIIKEKNEKLDLFCYEQITEFYKKLQKKYKKKCNLTGSEYIEKDLASGKIIKGIRHENALDLSFQDNSFDIIISNDVYEHVPDIKKAFKEAYRVLKPSGKLIFTIPFYSNADKTEARAKFENDELILLKEKQIHGNPMSQEGSLVFYDIGWDVFDFLKEAEFKQSYIIPVWDEKTGNIDYGPILIFVAEK